jgi:hypothetical protein
MRVPAWISIAIALSVLVGQAATADPEARNHGINQRQENQKDRVQQGVKSAELTRKETQEVLKTQHDVAKLEKVYKADGTLSIQERRDLQRELNRAGKEIRAEKHDGQQR